ncbi:MAG: 2-dehydropantoate 2-reductase [Solirubrobacterales bacterium]|nr:2-dehydropantoate 2-reductase [Solirubrobacterales bacterium]MBV9684219.1 2-dehydropantoate 2-reductase [Solirubrobacterales bacterium]
MRFVVLGAGAVGGVVGASLHQSGQEVALIARGEHYRAIREGGLTFERPGRSVTLEIPVANAPAALEWTGDEVVLLAAKSQDTAAALIDLRAAAPTTTPVVCLQNGVENERIALRLLPNVYGAVVMAPTAHLEPGVVQAYGTRGVGVIDLGRYPAGVDHLCENMASALTEAGISSRPRPDIMRFKYAKLINNLLNAVDAIVEPGPQGDELTRLAQEEGRAALSAAGIEFVAEEVNDVIGRWRRLDVQPIEGRPRAGSSTRQSLARGAPTLETDYLNGEISLIGRLHGVPTPVNDALGELSERHLRERRPPQSVPAEEVLARARAGHYADGPVRR